MTKKRRKDSKTNKIVKPISYYTITVYIVQTNSLFTLK